MTSCCTSTGRVCRNAAAALGVSLRGGRGRRRHRLVRRHQERAARGRGGRAPQPRARARLSVHPQAVDAARVEDAVPRRPVRRALDRRSVAPLRRERQRDGFPTRRRGRGRGGCDDHAARGDECGIRDAAAGGYRVSSARVPVLHVGRAGEPRSGGCARGTPPRRTWTGSPRRCGVRSRASRGARRRSGSRAGRRRRSRPRPRRRPSAAAAARGGSRRPRACR